MKPQCCKKANYFLLEMSQSKNCPQFFLFMESLFSLLHLNQNLYVVVHMFLVIFVIVHPVDMNVAAKTLSVCVRVSQPEHGARRGRHCGEKFSLFPLFLPNRPARPPHWFADGPTKHLKWSEGVFQRKPRGCRFRN